MAGVNICAACLHELHDQYRSGKCVKCECLDSIRPEIQSARALTAINNMLFGIIEILAEVHPEAVAAIDARREEARRTAQEASQQQEPASDQERFGAAPV